MTACTPLLKRRGPNKRLTSDVATVMLFSEMEIAAAMAFLITSSIGLAVNVYETLT
jgi:hypothetical protein